MSSMKKKPGRPKSADPADPWEIREYRGTYRSLLKGKYIRLFQSPGQWIKHFKNKPHEWPKMVVRHPVMREKLMHKIIEDIRELNTQGIEDLLNVLKWLKAGAEVDEDPVGATLKYYFNEYIVTKYGAEGSDWVGVNLNEIVPPTTTEYRIALEKEGITIRQSDIPPLLQNYELPYRPGKSGRSPTKGKL